MGQQQTWGTPVASTETWGSPVAGQSDLTAQNAVIDKMQADASQPTFSERFLGGFGITPESIDEMQQHPIQHGLKQGLQGVIGPAKAIYDYGKTAATGIYEGGKEVGNAMIAQDKGQGTTLGNIANAAHGVAHGVAQSIPFVGSPIEQSVSDISQGNTGAGVGGATALGLQGAAAHAAFGPEATPEETAAKQAAKLKEIPGRLVSSLGATEKNPENTLATYQQVLPHLAEIERTGVIPRDILGRVKAEPLFKATRARISQLGKPIDEAVQKYGDKPAGGELDKDLEIRNMIKSEIGSPNALSLTDPEQMELHKIGEGTGPLTIQESNTARQFAGIQGQTYLNAKAAGNPAADLKLNDWNRANQYLKNVEYGKLQDLTGQDVGKIQFDRSQLIKVQNTAMKKWASELKMTPNSLAQSLGVPFGFSRIVMGMASLSIPEVAGGAAEIGATSGWRALTSQQRVLGKTLKTLGRSNLEAPDYSLPQQPQGNASPQPPQPNNPAQPTPRQPLPTDWRSEEIIPTQEKLAIPGRHPARGIQGIP